MKVNHGNNGNMINMLQCMLIGEQIKVHQQLEARFYYERNKLEKSATSNYRYSPSLLSLSQSTHLLGRGI